MRTLAAVCLVSACTVEHVAPAPSIAVGGDSPLVAMFEQVGADQGIAPDTLAAASWVRTRFRPSTLEADEAGATIGLLAIAERDVAHAAELAGVSETVVRSSDAAALRAGAALMRADGDHVIDRAAIDAALSRGIAARDGDGMSIVVAAHRDLVAGYGTAIQGVNYPGAEWVAASTSNYQVASRGVGDIDHIVIHDTEGNFSGTLSWFQDPAAQVSAHYVVRSSDGHIVQMVAEKNIAWHDKCFNTHTIGIEHEGFAAHPELWYTEAMYASSAKLTAYLADTYGIAKQHGPILGHGEAPDCSDHTDPGPGWNWAHYIDLVQTGGASQLLAGDVVVDAPSTIQSGELARVSVTLANRGTATWDLDATRIGTQDPQDRDSALFVDGDWIAPNRVTAIDAAAAPNATGTFTFQIRGPDVATPMVYDEAFQLVQDDTWFGPTFHLVLQVVPADPMQPPSNGGCSTGTGGGAGSAILVVGLLVRRRRRRRRN